MGSDSRRDSGFILFLAALETKKKTWSESHLKPYNVGRKQHVQGKVDKAGPRPRQNSRQP